MTVNYYIPARFNIKTGQFEVELYANVAQNVYMSLDSDISVADVINAIPKNNMTAERDPTSNDYAGYSPGSQWFNHTDGVLWICKSISGTETIWTSMAAGAGN